MLNKKVSDTACIATMYSYTVFIICKKVVPPWIGCNTYWGPHVYDTGRVYISHSQYVSGFTSYGLYDNMQELTNFRERCLRVCKSSAPGQCNVYTPDVSVGLQCTRVVFQTMICTDPQYNLKTYSRAGVQSEVSVILRCCPSVVFF